VRSAQSLREELRKVLAAIEAGELQIEKHPDEHKSSAAAAAAAAAAALPGTRVAKPQGKARSPRPRWPPTSPCRKCIEQAKTDEAEGKRKPSKRAADTRRTGTHRCPTPRLRRSVNRRVASPTAS
jgi:hypothetical protein